MAQIFKAETKIGSFSPSSDYVDDHKCSTYKMSRARGAIPFTGPIRRVLSLKRSRRLPAVRLGGEKPRRRRGLFRRVRTSSLKVKCFGLLKKLKFYCRSLVEDVIEAPHLFDSFRPIMFLETACPSPVHGVPPSKITTMANN